MILSYYGRKTTVAECREICNPGRDGLSARTIAEAARQLGLRVRAYSLDVADFTRVTLPAIVHWDFSHFVIVESWSTRSIGIVDPALGRRRITPEEFDSMFTGIVLLLEPDSSFDTWGKRVSRSKLEYLRMIVTLSRPAAALMQIFLASIVLQVVGLLPPVFTKVLVDRILPFRLTNVMTILGVGIILMLLTQALVVYLRSVLLLNLRGRIDSQLMIGFFEHMLSLPYVFFQRRTSGDLLIRLHSNGLIREVLTTQTLSLFLDGSLVIIYLLVILVSAPVYGLIVLALGVLQIIVVLATHNGVRRYTERELTAQAAENSYLVEALKGISMLKASGAEDYALERWINLFYKQLNASLEKAHLSAKVEMLMGTLQKLSPLLLLWYGALLVLADKMSLGTMLALSSLAYLFLSPITSLVANGQQFQLIQAQFDRIIDVIEAEPEQVSQQHEHPHRISGQIEVRGLDFRYSAESPLVLRNISFNIEPGQKVAIVGPTGSGKSTIAMLLLGLYKPTRGEISFDHTPIEAFAPRTLRSQFGVVLQEPHLFHGTIRQNIAFMNPGASLEEVTAVAKIAELHDDIFGMPMKYETLISESGSSLSGGQRQRLSIARALLHKPSILIMDEASSHLDVATEARLDASLTNLSCTRIVIAHRLSTVRNADQIIVLDGGEIVECGTHDELISHNGLYAAFVQRQVEIDAAKV